MGASFLLRWFPSYRKLEQEVEALRQEHQRISTENLVLEDRIENTLRDRQLVWETLRETLAGERVAYQMHVNASWQRMGGGVPYPDAPHLASGAVPRDQGQPEPIGRRGRILPSEAVTMRTNQMLQEMYGRTEP